VGVSDGCFVLASGPCKKAGQLGNEEGDPWREMRDEVGGEDGELVWFIYGA
jgi:hypothetical protein